VVEDARISCCVIGRGLSISQTLRYVLHFAMHNARVTSFPKWVFFRSLQKFAGMRFFTSLLSRIPHGQQSHLPVRFSEIICKIIVLIKFTQPIQFSFMSLRKLPVGGRLFLGPVGQGTQKAEMGSSVMVLRLCSGSGQALIRYAHPQLRLKQQLLTSRD
jgi:hypothetical protein